LVPTFAGSFGSGDSGCRNGIQKWAEIEPDNSEALYYLAFFIWYRDDCDDAIDELDDAIEINSKVEKYYLTKAIWLHNLEEYEDAIVECKKCLALNQIIGCVLTKLLLTIPT